MPRILLVDDQEDVHEALQYVFKSEGHELVKCYDGWQAIDYLQTDSDFDLMLVDIRMPQVNGLQLMAVIRERWPGIPFVVISSYLEKETIDKAHELGCEAIIKKPFTLDTLLPTIRGILARVKDAGAGKPPDPTGEGPPV